MTKYTCEEIIKFHQYRGGLENLKREIEKLEVKDLVPNKIKEIIYKASLAVENYNKKVPKEFKEDFEIDFDIGELEEKISDLKEGFIEENL